MTAAESLDQIIDELGASVFPVWGVSASGVCMCPRKSSCSDVGKHPNGSRVPNGVLNASRDKTIVHQWLRSLTTSNWAVRCGEALTGPKGGFLGILDTDPRNGSDESLPQVSGGVLPETVTASTGGGGAHRYYRFPVPPRSRTCGPGLDLIGVSKYALISPSKHKSGGQYSWEIGLAPGEAEIADAPAWLLDGTVEGTPRPDRDVGGTARETVLGEAFFLSGLAGPVMPNGTMYVRCPQADQHSDARGRGEDASTVILPPAGGSLYGGWACAHSHCVNLKHADVLKLLPPEHVAAARAKYPNPLRVVRAESVSVSAPVAKPVVVDDLKARIAECAKRVKFKETKGGYSIVNDIVNANIILTYDPRWDGVLIYDEFSHVLRFTREPEWHVDDKPKNQSDVWTDGAVTCLDLWFRRNWGLQLEGTTICSAAYNVGMRRGVNPLTGWLDGLVWDGVGRLDNWVQQYLGCSDTVYHRTVGRKWLLSAVARAYVPGCDVHHMLILEGKQGAGKSTALSTLCPNRAWFGDSQLDLGNKDSYVSLKGKWIYELAELASLRRSDVDKVKMFMTSPTDSYRPPYGREPINVPRTVVFAGSVNAGEYLIDPTGARRFWPVKVGVIDLEGIVRDRDQLWAEAVAVYKLWVGRGSPRSECLWWPSQDEVPLFSQEADERQVEQPWTAKIASWLPSERARAIVKAKGYLASEDIGEFALDIKARDLRRGEQSSIGLSMGELGWGRARFRVSGARVWGYIPKRGFSS